MAHHAYSRSFLYSALQGKDVSDEKGILTRRTGAKKSIPNVM